MDWKLALELDPILPWKIKPLPPPMGFKGILNTSAHLIVLQLEFNIVGLVENDNECIFCIIY